MTPVSVVHLVFSLDSRSAVLRHHISLQSSGFDSHIICIFSTEVADTKNIFSLYNGQFSRLAKKLLLLVEKFLNLLLLTYTNRSSAWSLSLLSSLFTPKILTLIQVLDPDYINLHWLGYSCLDLGSFLKSEVNSKIIVSLHDEWFFSGGCHSQYNCKTVARLSCFYCPYARFNFVRSILLTNYLNKVSLLSSCCSIVAQSNSAASKVSNIIRCSSNSTKPSIYVRPIVDPSSFEYTLPPPKGLNRPYTFGIYTPSFSNKNKGFNLLLDALRLYVGPELDILVVGNRDNLSPNPRRYCNEHMSSYTVKSLGSISPSSVRSRFFDKIDCFLAISYKEAFGIMPFEAIVNGIPLITFDDIGPAQFALINPSSIITNRSAKSLSHAIKKTLSQHPSAPLHNNITANLATYITALPSWDLIYAR